MSLTVEGTLPEQEFVRLNRWLFYRKPPILLLHLVILGLGVFWGSRAGMEGARGLLAWSPLVVLLALFFMMSHKSRLQYRGNRTLQSSVRCTVTDEGLILETPSARAPLPWDQVARLEKAPRQFVIYGKKGQAYVVSKAWFDDADSLKAFVDAIEQGTGEGSAGGVA
jgi:hypothetical protein